MTTYAAAGSEFDVNSTFTRTQAHADSAQLAGGGFIVTWVDADFNTTAGRFIRAQLYQADGTPAGEELTLVSASGIITPAVTGLAGGGFVVTWEGMSTIRAQVFDQHGAAVAPAFDVSPAGASSPDRPDVAALDTGGFAIVWHDTRTSGGDVSGSAVHLRTFDETGAPLGPDRLVNSATAGNQADTSITALPDGHYVVTWTDFGARGSGASWLIRGRIVDAAGTPVGSDFVVNASTSNVSSVESSVTVLANGNFAVAWEEYDPTLGSGHRIQVFDPSGHAVGSQITVPHNLSGTQVGPVLTGLADGGFAIAWTGNYAPQSDGSGKAVFVQVFDAASEPTGGPMLVNTQANGDQFDPSLVAIASGGFVVTWTDLNGAGADDDQIKAQIFLPSGAVEITSDGGGETAAIAVDENQSLVTQVVAAGGQSVTYTIAGGADADRFEIDAATGELTFVAAPDYEAPADADGDNSYQVVVAASNGALQDTQTLTITVGNVNEAPVITSDGGGETATLTVMENTGVVGTVVAGDPEGTPTYRIAGGADADRFEIDAATGELTFVAAPDYEAPADADGDNSYEVVVAASDGALEDTQTLTVTVGNVNEAPVITTNGGGDTATLPVLENTVFAGYVSAWDPEGTPTYRIVGGADADKFAFDAATRTLTFVTAPDYEAPADADGDNSYEVVVAASDGMLEDTQTLVITVRDANEAPVITSNGGGDTATLTVMENTVLVGAMVANDPDGTPTPTYTIVGGADAGKFAINAATGALTFVAAPDYDAPADADGDNSYEVVVAASDGALQDTQTLTVTVGNVDDAPVITSNGGGDTATLGVMENNVFVGVVVASAPGGTPTYTIAGGADADRFAIDAVTGTLKFLAAPDYEAPADADGDNRYEVVVAASDGALQDTQTLSIVIGNLADGRTITGTNAADALTGGEAEDVIIGLDGNDVLSGQGGADIIIGGAGNDSLSGGDGDDVFQVGSVGGVDSVNGGAGNDRIVAVASGVTIGLSALSGIEAISANGYSAVRIAGSSASDTLDFSGVTLSGIVSIDGGSGNDIIDGSIGNDVILGGAGTDFLSGGDGDDVFQVGTGAGVDWVNGGAGEDKIVAVANGALIGLSAVSGIEAINANGYSAVKIVGSAASDTLDFSGVTLSGIASIDGGSGNDVIVGSIGNDVILGGAGSDSLSGGSGNDTLNGGAGSDQISGGAGSDVFVYAATGDSIGANVDTIVDFQSLEGDRIDLSAIDANILLTGDQHFTWIGNTAFHRRAGELREATGADGNLHIYGDTSGDGSPDFELILPGVAHLVGSNFIL